MPELFTVVAPDEAFERLRAVLKPVPRAENVPLERALGRTLAREIVAREALPPFARSAMDGFAVRARDTLGAAETSPVYLRLAGESLMGSLPSFEVLPGSCARIHTGAALPRGADAVVMIEETNALPRDEIEVLASVAPGEDVIAAAEDLAPGERAFAAGQRLRAVDVGGLAALGVVEVAAAVAPRVAVISTGDELVAPQAQPRPGEIRDVNGALICALLEGAGALVRHAGIVRDDEALLAAAAARALEESDVVVVSAGSSVSARDATARAFARLGPPGILLHGLAVKPGKPTLVACAGGRPVFGLPGNPVSAAVLCWRLVLPAVRVLLGQSVPYGGLGPAAHVARLAQNVPSRAGREDYVPVTLSWGAGGAPPEARPAFAKSNLIFSLVRSEGLLRVPRDAGGLRAGELAEIYTW
ncbi:molybdopterin molybdenumtransferase MoeA [bacterium]|nr:MAG: molybdopterin molybdenumtransferase MoeA [bacterium]